MTRRNPTSDQRAQKEQDQFGADKLVIPLRRIIFQLNNKRQIFTGKTCTTIIEREFYIKGEYASAVLHYKNGQPLVFDDDLVIKNVDFKQRVVLDRSKLSDRMLETLKYSFT